MENIGCLKIYFYPLTQNTTCMNPSLATSCGLSRAFNIYVSVGFLKKKNYMYELKKNCKSYYDISYSKKIIFIVSVTFNESSHLFMKLNAYTKNII